MTYFITFVIDVHFTVSYVSHNPFNGKTPYLIKISTLVITRMRNRLDERLDKRN